MCAGKSREVLCDAERGPASIDTSKQPICDPYRDRGNQPDGLRRASAILRVDSTQQTFGTAQVIGRQSRLISPSLVESNSLPRRGAFPLLNSPTLKNEVLTVRSPAKNICLGSVGLACSVGATFNMDIARKLPVIVTQPA